MRAATTTPVDVVPAFHARLGTAIGLPRCYGESASTTAFRGLLSVYSRCGPHDLLDSYRDLFKKCFSPFVTSWTAPCASGRSESLPGRNFTDGSIVPFQGTHNNAAERAMKAPVLGRKNWLFAGSNAGGERAAAMYSLLQTAKLNGINPESYLREVLERIADQPINRIAELLPWNLVPKSDSHEIKLAA